jgi:hypothetical protein
MGRTTEPNDLAHFAYYKQFDSLDVTMNDFLDYLNYIPKRLKPGVIRNGFESAKMMNDSFKTFVLENKGYNKKLFIKKFNTLSNDEIKSYLISTKTKK